MWKGWNRGVKEGLEGSGLVYGLVLPLAFLFAVIITGGVLLHRCLSTKSPPPTCSNYSFGAGYIRDKTLTCTRWPAMEMRIEERMIKEDIVHCTCTADSFPKAEK